MLRRPSPCEIAAPATLMAAILALLVPAPVFSGDAPGAVLLALLVTAVFIEGLPVTFPDRGSVTLGVLPAALLWHYFGPYIAAVVIGTAIILAHVVRRQPVPAVTAAVAIVAIWSAHVLAHAAVAIAPPLLGQTVDARLGVGVFCAVFAVTAPALSALVGDDHRHPEPISSLAMLPLAIILIGLAEWRGLAMLPVFLVGGGAVLLLVRSNVNMRTLHRQVTALTRQTEEGAQALTLERDTIAAIVNYCDDGICTVDTALCIRHVNPALTTLTGVRAKAAIGRPVEQVLGPAHAPATVADALRRALRDGRAVRVDSALETAEGRRELITSYTAVPGPHGALALGVGVVRDVTAEKEEVRIREDFFSLVTHDLRNPLTAMIGTTHLLGQELARTLDATAGAHRLLRRIEKANEQLLRLVNNLLELQRIAGGHELLRPQAVALRPLLEDLAAEFYGVARERGQTLRVTASSLGAWGDPTWCREILANLLSNAIKYTPREGTIDVTLETRGSQVAVSVSDTGHGLVPEEQEKLFTTCFRSTRPEIRAASGTGLGLALAKRMAERMGGDIAVRSTVGVGSTFTVLLPHADLPPYEKPQGRRRAATEALMSVSGT